MNKRLTAVAVAGTIGLGTVGAVAIPALANTTAPAPSQTPSQAPSGTPTPGQSAPAAPNQQEFEQRREAAIKEQLKSLVADGTLTQAQADKVAAKLAAAAPGKGPGGGFGRGFGGPGGPGREFGGRMGVDLEQLQDAAAKALGITTDQLRTQLQAGSTIADIAKKQNKNVDTVTGALVQAARQQLAQAVKDQKITQAMADQIEKNLPTMVKTFVENGRMGMHFRGGLPGGAPGTPGTPGAPAPTPSQSGTSQSSSFTF